jgi:DNA-binding GntR family transcriptional regulator
MDLARETRHPYQVLAAQIADEIERGDLRVGDRLPSVRALAQRFDVTTATAQRVIRELTDKGYVKTTPGLGIFVAGTGPQADGDPESVTVAAINKQLDTLQALVADISQRLQRLEDDRGQR